MWILKVSSSSHSYSPLDALWYESRNHLQVRPRRLQRSEPRILPQPQMVSELGLDLHPPRHPPLPLPSEGQEDDQRPRDALTRFNHITNSPRLKLLHRS